MEAKRAGWCSSAVGIGCKKLKKKKNGTLIHAYRSIRLTRQIHVTMQIKRMA